MDSRTSAIVGGSSSSLEVVPSRVEDKGRVWRAEETCVDEFSADECDEEKRLNPKDETFLMFLAALVSKENVGGR